MPTLVSSWTNQTGKGSQTAAGNFDFVSFRLVAYPASVSERPVSDKRNTLWGAGWFQVGGGASTSTNWGPTQQIAITRRTDGGTERWAEQYNVPGRQWTDLGWNIQPGWTLDVSVWTFA